MSSGLNWDEDYYNPFSVTARVYFDDNIRQVITDLEIVKPPGTTFEYLSGNTILLGMVLQKATGKNLSSYLSESFWIPMGMKTDALWQLDSEKAEWKKHIAVSPRTQKILQDWGSFLKTRANGTMSNYSTQHLLQQRPVQDLTMPRNMVMDSGLAIIKTRKFLYARYFRAICYSDS